MLYELPRDEIQRTENELFELVQKLARLRRDAPSRAVSNYSLREYAGHVSLLELFNGKDILFAIHNMGVGCRYCTLWADGLNGFLPHLEDKFAVALLSKDDPELQRRFANERGWRFRMVSHGGGDYMKQECASGQNYPEVVCYTRAGTQIQRRNAAAFGPGDLFCSLWHLLSLAGIGLDEWTPQYSYWKRPDRLDDGGENIR